ncbi:MAG: hypothetical protein CL746_05785 [Chloroflexi bacterium]|nr:hypothetical protein [Chloroflexota bacterium]
MENFYQFGALVSAITFSGAGIFIKKINTRNFFSIPFYEGLFSVLVMLGIIILLNNWQDTIFANSSSIVINFIIAATLSSTGTMIYIFSLSRTSIGIALTVCAAFNVLTASTYDYIINSISFDVLFFIGAALILISIFILNIKSFFSKNKINLTGVFGAILTGFFWGSAVFFNDKALIESNIFTASVIRSLTAMVVMFTASIFFSKKINFAKDIKIFKLFLVTVILLFLSNIVWFVSLEYTTGSLTTIFGSSAPIFGIILGYIFLKEKIGKIELLSLVVALSGIAIMISI